MRIADLIRPAVKALVENRADDATLIDMGMQALITLARQEPLCMCYPCQAIRLGADLADNE